MPKAEQSLFETEVQRALRAAGVTLHKRMWLMQWSTSEKDGAGALIEIDSVRGSVCVMPTAWQLRSRLRKVSYRLTGKVNGIARPYDPAHVTAFIKTRIPKIVERIREIESAEQADNTRRTETNRVVTDIAREVRDALLRVDGITRVKVNSVLFNEGRRDLVVTDTTLSTDAEPPDVSVSDGEVTLSASLVCAISRETLDAHPRLVAAVYERMRAALHDIEQLESLATTPEP